MTVTIYQAWRCQHVPTNPAKERFVATHNGRTLTSSTLLGLQRKIDAAMEEAFA